MNFWIVDAETESGDKYQYFFESKEKPTDDDIGAFLQQKHPDEFDSDGQIYIFWWTKQAKVEKIGK